MNQEKFNPSDPKYKTADDLPVEQRHKFRNVGDGFVSVHAASTEAGPSNGEREFSFYTIDLNKIDKIRFSSTDGISAQINDGNRADNGIEDIVLSLRDNTVRFGVSSDLIRSVKYNEIPVITNMDEVAKFIKNNAPDLVRAYEATLEARRNEIDFMIKSGVKPGSVFLMPTMSTPSKDSPEVSPNLNDIKPHLNPYYDHLYHGQKEKEQLVKSWVVSGHEISALVGTKEGIYLSAIAAWYGKGNISLSSVGTAQYDFAVNLDNPDEVARAVLEAFKKDDPERYAFLQQRIEVEGR